MATLLPIAEQQFLDGNGAPLVDGKVWFYVPGTTTPKDTYQDPAGTILNTNPVVLDAAGRATIYGTGAYRMVPKDAGGDVIFDGVTADTSSAGASWAGTAGGTANNIVLTAANFASVDGQGIDFVAAFSNTGAAQATVNNTAIPLKLDTISGPVQTPAGCIIAGNVYRLTYAQSAGLFHLTPVVDRGYVDAGDAAAAAYGGAQASSALTQAEAAVAAGDASTLAQAQSYAAQQASSALGQAETYAASGDASTLSQAETFATNADAAVTSACNSAAQGYANSAKNAAETYSDSQLATAQSTNASTYVQGVRISGVYTPGLPYSRSSGQVVVYVNFSPNSLEIGNIQYNINGTWVNVSG